MLHYDVFPVAHVFTFISGTGGEPLGVAPSPSGSQGCHTLCSGATSFVLPGPRHGPAPRRGRYPAGVMPWPQWPHPTCAPSAKGCLPFSRLSNSRARPPAATSTNPERAYLTCFLSPRAQPRPALIREASKRDAWPGLLAVCAARAWTPTRSHAKRAYLHDIRKKGVSPVFLTRQLRPSWRVKCRYVRVLARYATPRAVGMNMDASAAQPAGRRVRRDPLRRGVQWATAPLLISANESLQCFIEFTHRSDCTHFPSELGIQCCDSRRASSGRAQSRDRGVSDRRAPPSPETQPHIKGVSAA